MKSKVILKFEDVHQQQGNDFRLRRLWGGVSGTSLVNLLHVADLKANPREARGSQITEDIVDSLDPNQHDTGLFHYKTKGLLLAAHAVKPLERQRYELSFDDEDELTAGVLDGGHNLLALGTYMVRKASNKNLKFRTWNELRQGWSEYADQIDEMKSKFDFLVPVEVIYPQQDDEASLQQFERAILEICNARNNNAEVPQEGHDNKAGLYEDLKKSLPPKISEEVQWRTNEENKRIKVRDLLTLLWVPLGKLELPSGVKVPTDTQIYNSKQNCSDAFGDLMRNTEVTREISPNQREIIHAGVKSAIKMLPDLIDIYDQVMLNFPRAYNNVSPGFGRIRAVENRPGKTKFRALEMENAYPEGFIVPFVVAVRELMQVTDGVLSWKEKDPSKFVNWVLLQQSKKGDQSMMWSYVDRIKNMDYDPQRFAKSSNHYRETARDFRDLVRIDGE